MESLGNPARQTPGPIRQAVVVPIEDPSQVSVARRAVLEAGRRIDLDADSVARAEIVAVELARNILLHGVTVVSNSGVPTRRIRRPGEMIFSSTLCGTGVQIVAADSGRGIPNVARAMGDGFTTAGTPGLGLGAVRRLAREFDIFSALEPEAVRGTVVSAIVGPPVAASTSRWDREAAVVSTALPGETVSGDSWTTHEADGVLTILMVDGLGHGLYANEAAALAVELFTHIVRKDAPGDSRPLASILAEMHPRMRSTRGAAIALLRVHPAVSSLTFCGVGNISAVISDPSGQTRSLVSHNGTIGHQMPRTQEFTYSYAPGSLLIAHSDGITTSWKLQSAAGLDRRSAATIAGALYRDAWRGRDDATVMVARLV